jgi:hypothetical protein
MNTIFDRKKALAHCAVLTGVCGMIGGPVMALATKQDIPVWTSLGVVGLFFTLAGLGSIGFMNLLKKMRQPPLVTYRWL